ncbi:MAG TPA: methyltransferase [Rectinemataceae bacterium]
MPLSDLDSLVNKRVDLFWNKARLSFDLSHALFSSFDIDMGTRLLLKHLSASEAVLGAEAILDAGCGAGILGICLAAACPDARIVMRDRDLLACAFSERNLRLNGLAAEQGGSGRTIAVLPGLLGERDSLGPYDAVVSNLPAKAGAPVLSYFFFHARAELLKPGGILACVIVNTLADEARIWAEAAGLEVSDRFRGPGHTVYILSRPDENGLSDAPADPTALPDPAAQSGSLPECYLRSESRRTVGRYSAYARGYWGLPEFDTNSFATDLALEAMERGLAGSLVRDFLVLEPGIGLAPLWAGMALGPRVIRAISRDILSSRAVAANLGATFPGISFSVENPARSFSGEAGLSDALLLFPETIPNAEIASPLWRLMLDRAKLGAGSVIVAPSGVISRFEKTRPKSFVKLGEKRKKGLSALILRRE